MEKSLKCRMFNSACEQGITVSTPSEVYSYRSASIGFKFAALLAG